MDGQAWFQLLGSAGIVGIITAIVNAIINRRKMGADVSKAISEAAGSIVQRVEADNARLRDENEKLWKKARQLEQDNATLIDVVRDQQVHSRRQSEEIRRLGGHVEDPPELPAALLG